MQFGVVGLAAQLEKVNLKWGLHLLGIENSKIIIFMILTKQFGHGIFNFELVIFICNFCFWFPTSLLGL